MRQGMYWKAIAPGKKEVQCLLCPHVCRIPEDHRGICRVRRNEGGRLLVTNYGRVTAAALDPIEKKPLKRYAPGQAILSLGTFGCNLACGFCQNWQIAHGEAPPSQYFSPEMAVEKALETVPLGNIGLAYTYSEPLMWYEYVLDTAKLVREAGLKNILVTNGYINPKPLKELLPYLDAVNLDIKAYTDYFYQQTCQGSLNPVLESARLFADHCHLEITTLIIPGLNDSEEEIRRLARFIASLDPDLTLHLSRYFPNYHMDYPPTSKETMFRAQAAASEYLSHVYLGNL